MRKPRQPVIETVDLSYGATYKRLIELGYAPTSATNPSREDSTHGYLSRFSDSQIAAHPAALYLRPSEREGCDLPDARDRQLVALHITAYGAQHAPTLEAIENVIWQFDLSGGPVCHCEHGDRIYLFKFGGEKVIGRHEIRRGYSDEPLAVRLLQIMEDPVPAREPGAYYYDSRYGKVLAADPGRVGELPSSYIVPLAGDWQGGNPLTVARSKLPTFYANDLEDLIKAIERVRWDNRPAASEGDSPDEETERGASGSAGEEASDTQGAALA